MKFVGKWFLGYGAFLFLAGLAGYLSNPEAAKTALMSGTVFGGLSVLWGGLMLRGFAWARIAAFCTTTLLCGVFTWRSIVSWQSVAAGEPKVFAASLITLMLAASVISFAQLMRSLRVRSGAR